MSSSMKDFLDKFFDLCREYQEEIPPQKMAEVLRDYVCLLYTSPSPRDRTRSRMPSSA